MIHCKQLRWGPAGKALAPALDLYLEKASLTAIIGSNGCGKSTLLKTIAGWQPVLSGHLRVDAPRHGGIACLMQQQALDRQFPISLRELVAAGLWKRRLSRLESRQQLERALDYWQLKELQQLPLEALSGGQLQRALLARLDLTAAPLLLLDEPEAALDAQGQQLLWQRTQGWRLEGRTLLMVSHAVEHLQGVVDQVLEIRSDGCQLHPLKRACLEQVA